MKGSLWPWSMAQGGNVRGCCATGGHAWTKRSAHKDEAKNAYSLDKEAISSMAALRKRRQRLSPRHFSMESSNDSGT